MSVAGKIVKGTLITAGVAAGVGAFAVYNAGRYVKKLIYPPTLKKYVALGAIPFVLYGIKNPEKVVDGTKQGIVATSNYISGLVDVQELKSQLNTLESEKNDLEKRLSEQEKQSRYIGGQAALPVKQESPSENTTVSSYLNSLSDKFNNMIFVDKAENKLYLLELNSGMFKTAAVYDCTTGANPGNKSRVGDRATPEGIFYATKESESDWNEKFTDDRFRLDIPNYMGSGIFVTGAFDAEINGAIAQKKSVSNGGILLSANDFSDLERRLSGQEKIPVYVKSRQPGTVIDYTRGAE